MKYELAVSTENFGLRFSRAPKEFHKLRHFRNFRKLKVFAVVSTEIFKLYDNHFIHDHEI